MITNGIDIIRNTIISKYVLKNIVNIIAANMKRLAAHFDLFQHVTKMIIRAIPGRLCITKPIRVSNKGLPAPNTSNENIPKNST